MNTQQRTFKRAIGFALAAVLTAFIMAPTAAFAVTAAGTDIVNTATVTWSGNATGVSNSATVTVELLPTSPTLAFSSTTPAAATGAGVGSLTSVDVVYTATSGANGVDTYDLTWLSTANTGVSIPTYAGGNATTVELGGSMIFTAAGADVTIPGGIADHGLADGDTVMIGGSPYIITASAANGGDTDITLDGNPGAAAGTPIYERKQLTLTLTTGTFSVGTPATHALRLTAESQTLAAATATVESPTINVTGTSLTIAKTASKPDTTTQPGDRIRYSITVTNSGATNAANVVITDPIPAFTAVMVYRRK